MRKALKTDLTSRREFSDPAAFEDLYSKESSSIGHTLLPGLRHFTTLLEKFRGMVDIR